MVKRQDQDQQVLSVRISSLDDECDRVIEPLRIKLEIEVADRATVLNAQAALR
jgi:hypothetical protein